MRSCCDCPESKGSGTFQGTINIYRSIGRDALKNQDAGSLGGNGRSNNHHSRIYDNGWWSCSNYRIDVYGTY
jgi:hypothetical protein